MPIHSSQTEVFGDCCHRRTTMLFRGFALTQRIGITVVDRPVCMRVKQESYFCECARYSDFSQFSREKTPNWTLGFISCFGGRVFKLCVASVPSVVNLLQCRIFNIYNKQLRCIFSPFIIFHSISASRSTWSFLSIECQSWISQRWYEHRTH